LRPGREQARYICNKINLPKPITNYMAKVNIKPIGDRVLVQHIEEKEQVRGGIIIPDSAKEKPQEAKVIALGTGKKDDNGKVVEFQVKVGDRVLISKYGGTEVKLEDQKYTLVREDDILGVIA
jgi:chaperonin GroES